jgi:hypothetical protein
VDKLFERKLAKHQGDAHAGRAEATIDHVRQSLAGVDDAAVRQSLAGLTTPPPAHVLVGLYPARRPRTVGPPTA